MNHVKRFVSSIGVGLIAIAFSANGAMTTLRLDTRTGVRVARAAEPLAYSTAWNAGATGVSISMDGSEIFSAAAPADGDHVWNVASVSPGLHTLMLDDGVRTSSAKFQVNGILFDANGGNGMMTPLPLFGASEPSLPRCEFFLNDHTFTGWATTPDGQVAYTDGATVSDLAYANNAVVTLYAVWAERAWTLPDYLDAPGLSFETEGGEWSEDWNDFKVGGASLRSGELPPSDVAGKWTNTVLRTTVFGEGALSFWWKVSCEPEDPEYGDWFDYATFTVDGVEVDRIAGESGWRKAECAVTGAGTHSLEWTFFRDDYDEDGADWDNALWVDGVEWSPAPVAVSFDAGGAAEGEAPAQVVKWAGYALVLPGPGTLADPPRVFAGWSDGENVYAEGETYVFGSADATLTAVWTIKVWTLGEAVDATALAFTTGGNDVWAVDTAVGWTNGVSAKSGIVANGQSSWIETTVEGAGTLAFRWKVMGGLFRNNPFAFAKIEVDGTEAVSTHLTDGWEGRTLEIADTGTHTVRWTYLRTSARACDGDCAWIDAVAWTPAEAETPWIAGDDGTTVEGDGTAGWVVRPSAGNTAVEVVVPQGTDPAIVTVEVGTAVETVKPNGAVVKVVKDGFDITPWLDLPAAGADGVIDMAEANVKQAVADESLAPSEGASFTVTDEGPVLTTAPTKPGLTYTLVEGATLETMSDGATTQGDGEAWTPALTVKDGASGFYRIKVGK